MKLLNCTNKKTDKLVQYGLVDQSVAIEGDLLLPGKTLEVADKDQARVEAEQAHLFEVGALCWDVKENLPNALVQLPPTDEPTPTPDTEESPKEEKKKGR